MRNFQTIDDPTLYSKDENGIYILDEDGHLLADAGAVLTNVWGNESLQAGMFVDIAFSSATLGYTNFDVDLYHGSHRYLAGDLKIEGMSFGSDLSVDQVTVHMQNVDLGMSAIMLNNDEIGAIVTISMGAVHSSRRIYDLEPMIVAEITGWMANEKVAKLTCSGLMARWAKKTMRVSQSSCPWPIGNTECGYAGSETCSQTWSRCKALGNQLNFGGFVYVPELMEKKIYWGYLPPS